MAYTAQTITSAGDELDFLAAVRSFFVNNQYITFTVEEEDLTNYPQYFIVSVNSKLKIKVSSLAANENTQTSALAFTAYAGTNTLATANITYSSSTAAKNDANRTISLFVAQKGNSVVINAAHFTQLTGKGPFGALIIQDSNSNTVCWGTVNVPSASSLSDFYDPDTNTRYKISPYHTYQKAAGQLFLDPELPVLNNANSTFLFATSDIVGLGGAETQHFYTGINGDRYYCIMPNVAIKLEE